MAEHKYVSPSRLQRFLDNISARFVMREHKTGSDSEYKVLSDNNLTDELVTKINNAGVSDFGGEYDDLTNKPSIGGHVIQPGDQTAASLGLATPSDVSQATAGMATQDWVGKQGYQTSVQVESAISSKGYQTSQQVEAAISSKGYQTASQVSDAVDEAKSEMQSAISAAVGSVYEPKGSVAFASLPPLATAQNGDVYNITTAFVTTADFVEGSGKSYPAGSNVVCVSVSGSKKWDVLSGVIDLSPYAKTSDFVEVTEGEIDAMFDE